MIKLKSYLLNINSFIKNPHRRYNEYKHLKKLRNKIKLKELPKRVELEKKYSHLQYGVSVVIGTYKGEAVIDRCLESLKRQTLKHSLFEIIFIINGERDNTDKKIESAFSGMPTIDYTILYAEKPSLSAARNIGFKTAKKQFACFLDDDDFFSDNYLKEMLALCDNYSIVFSQIIDIDENGNLDPNNKVNQEILRHRVVQATSMQKLIRGITMSGGKMFPTIMVKDHLFDEALRNGEDVVYFTQLFSNWDFKFKVARPRKKVIYYRLIRSNSMSRQKLSYQFNILERIEVLKHLQKQFDKAEYEHRKSFIDLKMKAQVGFIRQYLKKYEDQRQNVYNDIIKAKLINFPYSMFNNRKGKKLVAAYCFPPYVDTSGVVVSKRIRMDGEIIDVIYNKMDTRRAINHNLSLIANEYIDEKFELDTPTTFSEWQGMNDYMDRGLEIIMKQVEKKGHYKKIYSRAMWPASHFLAYTYKMQHKKAQWTAEFSDPVIYNIHGQERKGNITNKDFLEMIKKELEKKKLPFYKSENIYFWCEYLCYAFADTILFTNENQKQYMLDRFPIQEIKPMVLEKHITSPHPVLDNMFYHIHESDYNIENKYVNLAYFGAFYQTRKLNELVKAVEELDEGDRDLIKIHVFTENSDMFIKEIKGSSLESVFLVNPYADFFEFLNLTKKFDCLIVNDAATKTVKEINPYLPSKLSDYLGSGTPIWGLYEEGSSLSKYDLTYKSILGDIADTKRVLEQIIKNKVKEITYS